MYKLKDIFNLNLNNGDGEIKLFNRIMRKYNIPKQDSKQLIKEIRNYSNDDSVGIKEYYYRVLDQNTIESIITLIMAFNGELLIDGDDKGIMRGSFCSFTVKTYKKIIGFKIYDVESYILSSTGSSYTKYYGPLNGDVYELFLQYSNLAGDTGATIEQVKELFSSMIKEITKEEYESMITYRP